MAATKKIEMRTFGSFLDLLRTGLDVLRGPTFLMTFIRVPARLREKILLAVTVANNCFG
jgi:hypothetical protein